MSEIPCKDFTEKTKENIKKIKMPLTKFNKNLTALTVSYPCTEGEAATRCAWNPVSKECRSISYRDPESLDKKATAAAIKKIQIEVEEAKKKAEEKAEEMAKNKREMQTLVAAAEAKEANEVTDTNDAGVDNLTWPVVPIELNWPVVPNGKVGGKKRKSRKRKRKRKREKKYTKRKSKNTYRRKSYHSKK
jgi:hypothetical protein